jgi:HK97 family phage major capsid protein
MIHSVGSLLRTIAYRFKNQTTTEQAIKWHQDVHEPFVGHDATYFVRNTLEQNRALNTGSLTSGGVLVPFELMINQFESLLYAARVVSKLGARRYNLNNGQQRIPRAITGTTAGFSAEGAPSIIDEPTYGFIDMVAKDISLMVPLTDNFINDTSYNGLEIAVADMVESLAQKLDISAFWSNGANSSILGAYYTPGVQILTATTGAASMSKDLFRMTAAFLSSNTRMRSPGWLMHPGTLARLMYAASTTGNLVFEQELARGLFRGYPYATTTNVPYTDSGIATNTILCLADFSEMAVGVSQDITIDSSNQATIGTAPNQISAFQDRITILRAGQRTDVALMQPKTFVFLKSIDLYQWLWV